MLVVVIVLSIISINRSEVIDGSTNDVSNTHIKISSVDVSDDDSPKHVHLAFGSEATRSVTISWESLSYDVVEVLGVGSVMGELSNFTQRTVPRNADAFVEYSSGSIRHATIDGLTASTAYEYTFASSSSSFHYLSSSSKHTFTTPPNKFPVSFSMYVSISLNQTHSICSLTQLTQLA
jgi:hypothetical protein